jgi:hypothetical protein
MASNFHALSPDHSILCAPGPGNAFAGSAGTSFTPHIITASPSEVRAPAMRRSRLNGWAGQTY